ncbi:LPD1 domain-containing protein [Moraxella catarrhalis]|uniref:LPD1 domain-containing protein n=1 Tax=Moraxella catarrhalis TaxID=480 RepID=UPI0013CFE56F|nr:LPD5 domain-containing protein [Moraxella catarrhalis]
MSDKKLDDFGEHIAGAKKELHRGFVSHNLSDEDIRKLPLSKLWAVKEIDAIENKNIAAIAHVLRGSIGTKPRQAYKLKRWFNELESSQKLIKSLMDDGDDAKASMVLSRFQASNGKLGDKMYVLSKIDRRDWKFINSIEISQTYASGFGSDGIVHSLRVDIGGSTRRFHDNNIKESLVSYPNTPAAYLQRVGFIDRYMDDIKDELNRQKSIQVNAASAGRQGLSISSFELLRYRTTGEVFISARSDRTQTPIIGGFASWGEAKEYLNENLDEIISKYKDFKEYNTVQKRDMRSAINEERTGVSYRDHDITPEEFMETFNVRGGQFGNWVNQDERTEMLNRAYDGFMDLSRVLKVEPKAIGLGGHLGIAFGARGSGWASAHYETGEKVINLTKTRGAGSLAHEWWHAADNYLSDSNLSFASVSGSENDQLADSIKGLTAEIEKSELQRRSKTADSYRSGDDYFSTMVEMTARSFETWVADELKKEGIKNDFLANISKFSTWDKNPETYPYPKEDELKIFAEKYSQIFDTVKSIDNSFEHKDYEASKIINYFAQPKSLNIKLKEFKEDPESKAVQDRVVSEAQSNPQLLIDAYKKISDTFDGRYIASDMMKEVFDDFNKSPASRNQFNNAVHNTAAALAAEHYKQMLNEPIQDGRDTVVFLTGSPGAGKTSSVMNDAQLDKHIGIVFEGQLANAHTSSATMDKIQAAIDKDYKVQITAVNPLPEQALENTFKRYYDPEDGRGAPISTMARIQGDTYEGLKAIHERFGDSVELTIVDKPNGNETTINYVGWEHLNVLQSQGTEVEIAQRLEAHLLNHYQQGNIDYDCFKQSAGSSERAEQILGAGLAGKIGRSSQENGDRRELPPRSSSSSDRTQHTSPNPSHQSGAEKGIRSSSEPSSVAPVADLLAIKNKRAISDFLEANGFEKGVFVGNYRKNIDGNKLLFVAISNDVQIKKIANGKVEDQSVILPKIPQKDELDKQKIEVLFKDYLDLEAAQGKTYLYTSPNDLDALKELKSQGVVGFDTIHKVWFTNDSQNADIQKYLHRPNIPTPEEAFAEHLKNNGIAVNDNHPIMDGRPHRISNESSRSKNVIYQFYPNDGGIPAASITNFSRSGTPEKWVYPAEYLNVLKNIEAVEAAKGLGYKVQSNITSSPQQKYQTLDIDKQALQNKAAERASMVMSFAPLAVQHNYLDRKQVTSNQVVRIVPDKSELPPEYAAHIAIANDWREAGALRQNNPDDKLILQKGNLIIPQYNEHGELRAFETIGYNGSKYAQKDAQKNGLTLTLGDVTNGKPVIIAEGYATAATLHEQTNQTVVVAFGKGGLVSTSENLRKLYPDSRIYIGADNDHMKPLETDPATGKPKENSGLVDANKAAERVSNTYVLAPKFEDGDKGKDWNDVFVDKGVGELKTQLKEQLGLINSTGKQIHSVNKSQPTPTTNIDDVVKKYPNISDENLQSIAAWRGVIARYESKEVRNSLYNRLELKLPALAAGEVLPMPKPEQMAKPQEVNSLGKSQLKTDVDRD